MNIEVKKELREKVWCLYGLSNVLKYNIDDLRKDVADLNLDKIDMSIRDINITVERLALLVDQFNYIIKSEGS